MQGDQIAWLLNLVGAIPQSELAPTNSRPIKKEHFRQLQLGDAITNGDLYTYDPEQRKFLSRQIILLPNILLILKPEGANHLILSNCTISKRDVSYKESRVDGIALTNSTGSTFIFFKQYTDQTTWYKQLKLYCKLSGFLSKYRLADKMHPGLYQCVKRKDKTLFTVQIYKMEDFLDCPELQEAVQNEIHILRSVKHQSLLELKRVYEDPKYMFIVYENYKGESLFQLVSNGMKLHEVQVASIIYQCLQVIKFLHQHQFYHGNVSPQTILINTNNQMLQITLVSLTFKEYKVNDTLDWILNRSAEQFISPETFQGVAPNIQGDLYSIGAVMYFMTFYDPTKYQVYDFCSTEQLKNEDGDFYSIMEVFGMDLAKLDGQEQFLKLSFHSKSQNVSINQALNPTSASQLDLMRKLLNPDPNQRYGLHEATKHHWFVNVKSKIKSMKVERKRKKPLPSLRTIIELREQSEMDLRMTIIQQNAGSQLQIPARSPARPPSTVHNKDIKDDILSDMDEFDDEQNLHSIVEQLNQQLVKQPSKKNHQQ